MVEAHLRWVAAWRQAVGASPAAVALVDLASCRFLEASSSATDLLGWPEEAVPFDHEALARLQRSGAHSVRITAGAAPQGGRAQRPRRRAEPAAEATAWAWAIRSGGGTDLGLWIRGDTDPLASCCGPATAVATHAGGAGPGGSVLAVGAADGRWRVVEAGADAERLLGYGTGELAGETLMDLVHPADSAAMLIALARATAEDHADVRFRLRRRDGIWWSGSATIRVAETDDLPGYAIALAGVVEPAGSWDRSRLEQLEYHMRRIAAEIEASGVLGIPETGMDLLALPPLNELSSRQWEVVHRLVRGERVPAIAEQMYLSQGTVRNHLSAVFRKVGVHSQQELIAVLRDARRRQSASAPPGSA
ncbi:MAG TPA: LuxR C-terminal-related transcriptional regulator [Candidatus Dormibacteraeota bacterium]